MRQSKDVSHLPQACRNNVPSFFFPLCARHAQLRIRMKCPRGVTISSHVSAASHTCIRCVLLHILPAYSNNSESAECDSRIHSLFIARKCAWLYQIPDVSATAQRPVFVFSLLALRWIILDFDPMRKAQLQTRAVFVVFPVIVTGLMSKCYYVTEEGNITFLTFQVFTAVVISLWYFSFVFRRFGRTFRGHFQGDWCWFKWMLKWLGRKECVSCMGKLKGIWKIRIMDGGEE